MAASTTFVFAILLLLPLLPLLPLLLLTHSALARQPDPTTAVPLRTRRALSSVNKTAADKSHEMGRGIAGFVLGSVVGVIGAVLGSVVYRFLSGLKNCRFSDPKGPAVFSSWIRKKAGDLAFLETDDGVAGLEKIGEGGCGVVYRASLPSDPQKVVAIKRIDKVKLSDPTTEIGKEESKLLDKQTRQLRNEIQTVSQIRHRNLVPLLAHVPRPNCHYLLYEFMKNGSLQDALKGVISGQRELPWTTRLHIAQDIARGLEYLHIQHIPKIIHRDLKPANILLDDDHNAKITDFGLAKAIPDANTHITFSKMAGTLGYIAPEYYQRLRFTDKCDVYSFGVILAVLVVGKEPTDTFYQTTQEIEMMKWVRNVINDGDEKVLEVAVDRRLVGGGHEKQMVLVLKVACFCASEDPKNRPNSKEVRFMLDQIAKEV